MKTKFGHWHEVILAICLVALLGSAAVIDPAFVTLRVQADLANSVWELILLALPMTLIISTGGIDLSVGASMSLSAVAMGLAFEKGAPVPVSVLAALAVGSLAGALNGLFVTKVKVHPLIVTLASMSAFYGFAEGFSNARPISGFPSLLSTMFSGTCQAAIAVVAVSATVFLSNRTAAGQTVFSIGYNETASRFSGINVDKVKTWLYTLSGSAAAMAAVFFVARRNTAKADIGQGIELEVITAVVLGGTSITGGKGSVVGTLLGVLLVHETRQFVSWHWERDELNQIVIGALLVLTVLIKRLFDRSSEAAK